MLRWIFALPARFARALHLTQRSNSPNVHLSPDQLDAQLTADQLEEIRHSKLPRDRVDTSLAEAERLRAEWNRPPF